MKKPYVISINSVSGGGKTALATLVAAALPKAMIFCFDDFDASNIYPDDFYEWSQRGANPLAIDCPGMGEAVTRAIARGTLNYLVLDCPLGRDHPRFASIIDLAVFIDTPLDVALARRILRDHTAVSDSAAADQLQVLRKAMIHYLAKARYPYLEAYKQKATCELVLDGWQDLAVLGKQVLRYLQERKNENGFGRDDGD
jgi:uridine kinase